ncbi:hypothetical protein DFA_09235 [Cavenderia fasciculata]|uniref:Ankyrin repeat-containing protein n=1 Tax=Cavenderia fasciculata TaxID=261658 RepID=F4Q723_CACFS|nr:uncharacterized protein DFA_09235 [Cavenderia fasciculata]EGG16205.1 hypothetical protein DFA_09235 [Cavenderia fasciculata]|eukprot:XP_004354589.1 hypothetical protein DFA_09235 [Cavenderia fasciculata]
MTIENQAFFSVFRNIVLKNEIFGLVSAISKTEGRKAFSYQLATVTFMCDNEHYGLLRDKLLLDPKRQEYLPLVYTDANLKLIASNVEDLEVFKIVFEQETEQFVTHGALCIDFAAANKNIEVLKYVDTHPLKLAATTEAMDKAARAGLVANLEYLQNNRTEGATCRALEYAADKGNREVIEWLFEHRTAKDGLGCAVDGAARSGHFDIVKLLTERDPVNGASARAIDHAAQGHMEIVEYLLTNRSEFCTKDAITNAAQSGRLDLVKLLHKHNAPATRDAMDSAARLGLIDIVKFLHENRVEGCSDSSIGFACMSKHAEVAKYLIENDYPGTVHAMNNAAFVGDLEIVKLLHKKDYKCNQFAMDLAAQNGHLDIVEFLHINRTEGCTKRAMDLAALKGFLGVVQFLHFNRAEGCSVDAMDMAAHCGHFEVIQFLHANRTEGCTALALSSAVLHGRRTIVEFLVENRAELTVPRNTLPNEEKYPNIHSYLNAKREQSKSVKGTTQKARRNSVEFA